MQSMPMRESHGRFIWWVTLHVWLYLKNIPSQDAQLCINPNLGVSYLFDLSSNDQEKVKQCRRWTPTPLTRDRCQKRNLANSILDDKAVLDYLRKVNRPYSASCVSCSFWHGQTPLTSFPLLADIFNNLHGKYQKPGIVKALERLTEQEVVASKTYGKMNIYTVKQVARIKQSCGDPSSEIRPFFIS